VGQGGSPGADLGRLVYRPTLSRVLLAVFTVFGAWAVVDVGLQGRTGPAVLAALWLVAVVAALSPLLG